ncbi:MAG: six-cysteine ranthipeptide SCIFF [Bacillota bacterium]|nr:six-cysteine peptide SCIFF [Bacillota bacterium]HOB91123.1 six-cysteine ranthipeptide SCIFF [Bacillota bacterium]HPZ54249.1 six-cysteine ranthipeptide SCIFF [Bacillota bacterium]HQD18727.1 six-cysteine ranthipeptide SCIFF [Bacillota bacterium]
MSSNKLVHVTNVIPPRKKESFGHLPCHECRTSCQSACKTSCTVGNQPCANQR